jgi:hypothetical protein
MTTDPLPPDAQMIRPPAVYQHWWAMTEACSGRSGDMSAVRWYEVPGSAMVHKGQTVNGYWSSLANEIVLPEDYVHAGFAVRHEMLHALLREGGHPRDQFLGACAALVDCGDLCARDAGAWNPPMPFVPEPADSVVVTAEIALAPLDADGDRWLSLWVSVRNPSARAIFVESPVVSPTPPAFGFDVRGPKGGIALTEAASDSSRFFFEPLETRRFLFEFLVADTLTSFSLPPGDYVMRGVYARRPSVDQNVTVTP